MDQKVFGIDLGATYSAIGHMNSTGVDIITDGRGSLFIPSTVGFTNREVVTGMTAVHHSHQNSKGTIYDSKMMFGRSFTNPRITAMRKQWGFDTKKGPNNEILIELPGRVNPVRPHEVSGEILKSLAKMGEGRTGQKVKNVVISIPANFNNEQREETMKAARYAGLNVLNLVHEPTAAAVAYGYTCRATTPKKVVIFDFGGGTLDVSLMEIKGMDFTVKAVEGDVNLGGRDFDRLLVDEFIRRNCLEKWRDNPRVMQMIRLQAQEAKEYLSQMYETEMITIVSDHDVTMKITRREFEKMMRPLLDRILAPVERVLRAGNVEKEMIDDVIIVGGSTNIPAVRKILKDFFRKEPYSGVDPWTAVAMGTTILAAKFQNQETIREIRDLRYHDICPLSLGISTLGDVMSPIISRNSQLPAKKTSSFRTVKNWQTGIHFDVFEGESPLASNNTKLGSFTLSNIPRAEAGEIPVIVTFEVDENGILKVSAETSQGNVKQEIVITKDTGSYSPKEVEDKVSAAERDREKDLEKSQKQANQESLKYLYENVVSYLKDKEYDGRQALGEDEFDDFIDEVESLLKDVESRAGPGVCEREKEAFRNRLKPFIDRTGHIPYCIRQRE